MKARVLRSALFPQRGQSVPTAVENSDTGATGHYSPHTKQPNSWRYRIKRHVCPGLDHRVYKHRCGSAIIIHPSNTVSTAVWLAPLLAILLRFPRNKIPGKVWLISGDKRSTRWNSLIAGPHLPPDAGKTSSSSHFFGWICEINAPLSLRALRWTAGDQLRCSQALCPGFYRMFSPFLKDVACRHCSSVKEGFLRFATSFFPLLVQFPQFKKKTHCTQWWTRSSFQLI